MISLFADCRELTRSWVLVATTIAISVLHSEAVAHVSAVLLLAKVSKRPIADVQHTLTPLALDKPVQELADD